MAVSRKYHVDIIIKNQFKNSILRFATSFNYFREHKKKIAIIIACLKTRLEIAKNKFRPPSSYKKNGFGIFSIVARRNYTLKYKNKNNYEK